MMAKKLKCPECGDKFAGAAGLGRHRAARHGVKGGPARAKAKAEAQAEAEGAMDPKDFQILTLKRVITDQQRIIVGLTEAMSYGT